VPRLGPSGEDVAIYPTAIVEQPAAEIDSYTWRLSCVGDADFVERNPLASLTSEGLRNWTGPCDVTVTVLDRCGATATAMTTMLLVP
jgi:hypothetical protein